MTTDQVLLLAQTLILLFTGAVVVWYTVETARIRRATSDQARLLAEQLSMLRVQNDREEARKMRSVQPEFRYHGGQQTDQISTFIFTNVGSSAIRDLAVDSADYRMTIEPNAFLATNENVTVGVPGLKRPTPRFEFSLEFTDTLGVRRRRDFTHVGDSRFESREAAI